VAYTDDGKTLALKDDLDVDGLPDAKDNCPFVANKDQLDSDGDGIGDSCDNCVGVANPDQADINGNGMGDACDPDKDGDGHLNAVDNCPGIPNADQADNDGDGIGDPCDPDDDNDGIADVNDNCPFIANPDQVMPADSSGCSRDADHDGVSDAYDNCSGKANPDQKDLDKDGMGDACDDDMDNDSVANARDNCPGKVNPRQEDGDKDGLGDACDAFWCLVVDRDNPDACMNPNAPFQLSAGGKINTRTGENVRLPIFSNRNGVAIQYSWAVLSRPDGSKANIDNPSGAVSASYEYEYVYVNGKKATFHPDAPGDYLVQLNGTLVFPDRVYPGTKDAATTVKVHVDGDKMSTGCSTGGIAGLLSLMPMLGLLRRRNRK
jgi:hypothetical protein